MCPLLACAALLLGAWNAPQDGAPPAAGAEQDQAEPPEPAPQRSAAARLGALFGGALVEARDHEDFTETPGYRQMLEFLQAYSPLELQQKAEGRFDVGSALGNPDLWRGRIEQVRALVAKIETVRLERTLGDHVDVYRAFLAEADGSEGIVVDFLSEPPELETGKDVVDVEAVFFRIVRYENKKGEFVNVPQLIARDLRKLVPEEEPRSTVLDYPALIFLLAAVGYLVVRVTMTMRKKKRDPDAARASRAIRERAAALRSKHPPLSS